MNSSDNAPGSGGPDDDRWNVVLDDDFVNAATVKESRPGQTGPGAGPDAGPKRVWPRNLALALCAAALAFLVLKVIQPSDEESTASAPASASASAPTAGSSVSATPSASASASASAPAAAAAADRPAVPLEQVFPAEVKDAAGGVYTKLGAAVLASCVEPDSVGPRLIALIKRGKGCVSHQVALYKDAQNNQFNVSVFTMKDPKDTLHLVTELSMAFDDYQVGAQAPPPSAGLPVLAADSGMIQTFAGVDRVMIVTLGQWADGRVADYQKLTDRTSPLSDAVSKNVSAYEIKR
ncbi:hypothetical protein OG871_02555 [Kitasatospora sp. NBC_00374]|uniref:hypothetical protein n=1 Tax=Kitasatospora sp. NBC_00374 TaxID=2975964 RepID=UPI003250AEC8